MRSAEEMVRAVHVQAGALQRAKTRRRLSLTGGACGFLSVLLLGVIGAFGGLLHHPLTESYAGASLLGDSVGGYVLVAAAVFMLGVAVTTIIKQQQKKKSDQQKTDVGLVQKNDGLFLDDNALLMAAGGRKTQEKEQKEDNSEITGRTA